MVQDELYCLLMLLGVSPLLFKSLWTRPKPVVSAIFQFRVESRPLPQEVSLLSVWEPISTPC